MPELMRNSGLTRRPIFVPSVGNFRQGMLVSIPLHLDTLPGKPSLRDLELALDAHTGQPSCQRRARADRKAPRLAAEDLNATDKLELLFGKSRAEPRGARCAARQSRQRRRRRRGAEHPADAGARRCRRVSPPSLKARSARVIVCRCSVAAAMTMAAPA